MIQESFDRLTQARPPQFDKNRSTLQCKSICTICSVDRYQFQVQNGSFSGTSQAVIFMFAAFIALDPDPFCTQLLHQWSLSTSFCIVIRGLKKSRKLSGFLWKFANSLVIRSRKNVTRPNLHRITLLVRERCYRSVVPLPPWANPRVDILVPRVAWSEAISPCLCIAELYIHVAEYREESEPFKKSEHICRKRSNPRRSLGIDLCCAGPDCQATSIAPDTISVLNNSSATTLEGFEKSGGKKRNPFA